MRNARKRRAKRRARRDKRLVLKWRWHKVQPHDIECRCGREFAVAEVCAIFSVPVAMVAPHLQPPKQYRAKNVFGWAP